jgi:hypothetical protein
VLGLSSTTVRGGSGGPYNEPMKGGKFPIKGVKKRLRLKLRYEKESE